MLFRSKDVVLDIALKLGNYIENNNKDVKVVYTSKTDIYLTLKERARIDNKNKGDLFISIHADAIPAGKNSSTAYGAGTFTMGVAHSAENLEMAKRENTVILLEDDYQTSYASFDPKSSESYIMFELLQGTHQKQSFQIAQSIQKELTTRAKRNNRDVRQAPILVLKEASMPSVLVEVGFLSNINEERFLNSQDGRKTISEIGRAHV